MSTFNYGENLRLIRISKGISQEAMALALDISQATYSRIESQTTAFDYRLAFEMAKILNVPVTDLLPDVDMLELQNVVSKSGAGLGLGRKTNKVLKRNLGKIKILVFAYVIVNVVYSAVKGICSAYETSHNTMMIAGLISALLTSLFIYYWVRKNKVWK
ncbi:helix-turn-helix protein [compost metagenome]